MCTKLHQGFRRALMNYICTKSICMQIPNFPPPCSQGLGSSTGRAVTPELWRLWVKSHLSPEIFFFLDQCQDYVTCIQVSKCHVQNYLSTTLSCPQKAPLYLISQHYFVHEMKKDSLSWQLHSVRTNVSNRSFSPLHLPWGGLKHLVKTLARYVLTKWSCQR